MSLRHFILVPLLASPAFAQLSFESELKGLSRQLKSENHNKVFENYLKKHWQHLMHTYPEWATHVGYPGLNDKLSDRSLESVRKREQEPLALLEFLKKVDRARLNPSHQVTLDLLMDKAQQEGQWVQFPNELLAIDQMGDAAQNLAELLNSMPRQGRKDFEDRLARLKLLPQVLKENERTLREGIKQKVTPPRSVLGQLVSNLKKMVPKDPRQSPFFSSFKDMPKAIAEDAQKELQSHAEKLIRESIYPKMMEYIAFIEKEYIPNTRTGISISSLPNGKAWYDLMVRQSTSLELSAEEVHQIGLREVARLNQKVDELRKRIGFKGDHKKFIKYLVTSKQHRFKSEADMLTTYRAFAKQVDARLPQYFGQLPRTPYGVEPIPAYSAATSPIAYYNMGALNVGRSGIFYLNTTRASEQNRWEAPSLTMHEAVPGHHLQVSLAQEMADVPEVRRYSGYTAYTEGWALYAETLGYEMDLYQDPYKEFGQVNNELWRACRLVVDTGLHAKGWTRKQAIDYMKAYLAMPEANIIVEVDRYIVWPGQALAYKLGQMKFTELRANSEKALGESFSIREFHDMVLGNGALPLTILERLTDQWIQAQLSKKK